VPRKAILVEGFQLFDLGKALDYETPGVKLAWAKDNSSILVVGPLSSTSSAMWRVDLSIGSLHDRACSVVARPFTLGEWNAFLPDVPTRPTCGEPPP
jgi:hypothetical protein